MSGVIVSVSAEELLVRGVGGRETSTPRALGKAVGIASTALLCEPRGKHGFGAEEGGGEDGELHGGGYEN